jgi:hypothetical protein
VLPAFASKPAPAANHVASRHVNTLWLFDGGRHAGRVEAGVTDGTFTDVGQRDAPGTGDDVLQGGALEAVRVEVPSGDGTALRASSGNLLRDQATQRRFYQVLIQHSVGISRRLSSTVAGGLLPTRGGCVRRTPQTGAISCPSPLSILSTFAVHLSWNHATWRVPPRALLSRARGSRESVRAFAAAVEVAPATAPVATGRGSESPSTSRSTVARARRISVRFRDRAVSRTDAFGSWQGAVADVEEVRHFRQAALLYCGDDRLRRCSQGD